MVVLAANGFWLWTIVAITIWVALAFWPARVAARKGHSFFGYFIASTSMVVGHAFYRSHRDANWR